MSQGSTDTRRARRAWFLAALAAGALLRLAVLPLPGTFDVTVWKVWSFGAAHDVTGMYGVGGSPPDRHVVHWGDHGMTVDYPPVALYELAVVGRAYRWFDPRFRESPELTASIKLPGVLFEILLLTLVLTWGRRRYGTPAAEWTGLALWLNPAILLDGPVLGYLDPTMFVPLVVAVVAAWCRVPWIAGASGAIAVLTKPQAIFVMPVVLALLTRRGRHRWMKLAECTGAATLVAAAVLLPYVLRGSWTNLVTALSRLAAHDMLSAQAANIWWIATWVLRVVDSVPESGWYGAVTQPVRILGITDAIALGYPSPRAVGLCLVSLATVFAVWRALRVEGLAAAAAVAGWSGYAYTMLAAQVHENHLVPAVPILAIAAGLDRRFRGVFWSVSLIAALNLYLFYGTIPGTPPLLRRHYTVVDATVLLSVVNLGVFLWLTRLLITRQEILTGPAGYCPREASGDRREVDGRSPAPTRSPPSAFVAIR